MSHRELQFQPSGANVQIASGLVLRRISDKGPIDLRITHVFPRSVYAMHVSTPEESRNARRPRRYPRSAIDAARKTGELVLGRLEAPAIVTTPYPKESEESLHIETLMQQINPLLTTFSNEVDLDRWRFASLIEQRASDLSISPITLRRRLLKYWYFGGVRQALLYLPRGRPVGQASAGPLKGDLSPAKRRGRKSRLERELGRNEFVVSTDDISDMVAALQRKAKEAQTTFTDAHESYLEVEFAQRHPETMKKYLAGQVVAPVSLRQFAWYVKQFEALSEDLRGNVPALSASASARALGCSGPGDVYEIDASGGQIFLVDSRDRSKVLCSPTIYIVIDRWSRYVVAIYVTLRPPSSESLRLCLRIAFTSRTRRFKQLGFPIDDRRWPPGVVPNGVVLDRGAEMISRSMLLAAVEGMRIEALPLPAQTPDGKAIVERVIRTLKERARRRGARGSYKKIVFSPEEKAKHKQSRSAAVLSLKELYRVLITVVDEYNHAVHKGLKKRAELRVAKVQPVPVDAYLWGLEHLTGIQRPFTDQDYERMTLTPRSATLAAGSVRFRGQRYLPANDAAHRLAVRSTTVAKAVGVLVDDSDPTEIYMSASSEEWPTWEIDDNGRAWYEAMTYEEEDYQREEHALLDARAAHRSQVDRIARRVADTTKPKTRAVPKVPESAVRQKVREKRESDDLDRALAGKPVVPQRQRGSKAPSVEHLAERLRKSEEARITAETRQRRGR